MSAAANRTAKDEDSGQREEGADQLSETRLLASFDRLAVTMSLKVKQIKASIRMDPSVSSSEKRYYIFQLVDEKVFYIAHLITVISSNRRARHTQHGGKSLKLQLVSTGIG